MRPEAEVRKLLARRQEVLAKNEQHCLMYHAKTSFDECPACWPQIERIAREIDILEWVLEAESREEAEG